MRIRLVTLLGFVLMAQVSLAQDLADLASQLEQLKLAHWQRQIEQRPSLGLFVVAPGLADAEHVQLTLSSEASAPRDLTLKAVPEGASEGAAVALADLPAGRYQVDARWTSSSGEVFHAQHAFVLMPGWNELELRFAARRLLGDKLDMAVWQRAPAQPGSWQRVAAWVPGLIGTELRYARRVSELPAMHWAQAQCRSNDTARLTQSALLEILHTLALWPAEELEAEAYSSLTQCLLAAGLPRAAAPIISEWAARYPQRNGRQELAVASAIALARFAHWPELVHLGEAMDDNAVVRFYAALAARMLGQHAVAQAQFEALYFERRAHDVARFSRSQALTLQAGYNLALAYVDQGQAHKAMTVLDDIGRQPVDQDAARHVVDLANLKLGWMLLEHDHAASAAPVFRRMSLDGPFSRKALLGLGWSNVLPAGQPLQRVVLDYPPLEKLDVDTSALAVWTARWRAGEISCEALLAATRRIDLCSPRAALSRDAGNRMSTMDVQRQVLSSWAELKARPAEDLVTVELLLGLSGLLGEFDHEHKYLAVLQHAENVVNAFSDSLRQSLELAQAGDPKLWQQPLPVLQLWLRSAHGYGLSDLARQLEHFTHEAGPAAPVPKAQHLRQQLHQALYSGAREQLQNTHKELQRYELDLRVRLARQLDMLRNG